MKISEKLHTFRDMLALAPLPSKYLTIRRWPFCELMNSGEAPSTIWQWISALLATSSSTTSRWLHWHATNNGVPPSYNHHYNKLDTSWRTANGRLHVHPFQQSPDKPNAHCADNTRQMPGTDIIDVRLDSNNWLCLSGLCSCWRANKSTIDKLNCVQQFSRPIGLIING